VRNDRKRGAILVIVLGFLLLLAMLAFSFATLQVVERRVTGNYADEVRARLTAQSGIDMVTDRLSYLFNRGWFVDGFKADRTWINFGDLTDESQYYTWLIDPLLRPGLTKPLEQCKNPSFANETDNVDPAIQDPYDLNTTPRQIKIEGQDRSATGFAGGTYATYGDPYAVKVIDCQSQINVNDGVQYGSTHAVSQNLKRMLNLLGNQLSTPVTNLGDLILAGRPPQGYRNKYELFRALNNDQALFDRARDFLTTSSWTNTQVHNPVPLSGDAGVLARYPVTYSRPTDGMGATIYRLGHGKNRLGDGGTMGASPAFTGGQNRGRIDQYNAGTYNFTHMLFFDTSYDVTYPNSSSWRSAVWNKDALNPQWIEVVARSPVNVNTASPEVLLSLLIDLEGFYINERRFPNPADLFYGFLSHRYYYDPVYSHSYDGFVGGWARYYPVRQQNLKHSEVGYCYRTSVIHGPGSKWGTTTTEPTVASNTILRELLACRERQASPNIAGVNYNTQPFGGPFRTWAQFNRFCDFLVERGVIVDSRDVTAFYDYRPWSGAVPTIPTYPAAGSVGAGGVSPAGNSPIYWKTDTEVVGRTWVQNSTHTRVLSGPQIRMAAQAAADVLKANFNPNLHLNELNPDRNLFTLVDKSDLIVNSTEFCFTPMGAFEVECVGYVLRPTNGGSNALTAPDNQIVARKKIATVVQLFEAKHVTLQSELYQGDFGARKYSSPTTNNGRGSQTGPEADNGPQPMECNWDGYVSLPTHGGIYTSMAYNKPKGTLGTTYSDINFYPGVSFATPMGSVQMSEFLYVPFQLDFCAHYHLGGAAQCKPIGPNGTNPGSATSKKVKAYRIDSADGSMPKATAISNAMALAAADAYFSGCTGLKDVDAHPAVEGVYQHPVTTTSYYKYMAHSNLQFHTGGTITTRTPLMPIDDKSYGRTENGRWADPDLDLIGAMAQCDAHIAQHAGWVDTLTNAVRRVTSWYAWDVMVEGTTPPIALQEQGRNFPDVPEGTMGAVGSVSGPYSPPMSTWQTLPNKYRLCNTYSVGPLLTPTESTGTLPAAPTNKYKYGPSDLRSDGAYVELHSAFGYDIRNTRLGNFGVISFWYKPNYYPECTLRLKSLLSLANYYQRQTQGDYGLASMSYPLPFNLFFLPSYHTTDTFLPTYGEPGRPAAFLWAGGADRNMLGTGSGGGIGTMTPALNHEYETSDTQSRYSNSTTSALTEDFDRFTGQYDGGRNELRHHEWTHVIVGCAPGSGFQHASIDKDPWWGADPGPRFVIHVNGRVLPGTNQMVVHVTDGPNDYSVIHGDFLRIGGDFSEIGIKDENGVIVAANGSSSAPRMYYADGTIDEFFAWRNGDFRPQAIQQFRAGRYYRPDDDDATDGLFTSMNVDLARTGRSIPPGSAISSPPSSETVTTPPPLPFPGERKRRLIAVAWTALGEDYRTGTEVGGTPRVEPYFNDYQYLAQTPSTAQQPLTIANNADMNSYAYPTAAQMFIIATNGATVRNFGPYHNEAWSVIRDSHENTTIATKIGGAVQIEPLETVKFRVKLRVGQNLDTLNSVLLAAPVLDDVTLFFDRQGGVHFVR